MDPLDRLTQTVDSTTGVMTSAATLLQGLGDYIRTHANDPVAMNGLADRLTQKSDDLTQAIANNPLPGEVVNPAGTTSRSSGGRRTP